MNADVYPVTFTNETAGVMAITLNRPQVLNAFNREMLIEISSYLDLAAQDPQCRMVVLRANGRHFCAGADLAWMEEAASLSYEDNCGDALLLAELLAKMAHFPLPIVAVAQGAAFGGALGLLATSDVVIATDDLRCRFSEARLGLIPATISPFVINAIGVRATQRFFLTGEEFDANAAQRLGLVHLLATPETVATVLKDIFKKILANGPGALRATKELIRHVTTDLANASTSQVSRYTSQLLAAIRVAPEAREGITAFLQKREPEWRVPPAVLEKVSANEVS